MPAAVRIKMEDNTGEALTKLAKSFDKTADAADEAGKSLKATGEAMPTEETVEYRDELATLVQQMVKANDATASLTAQSERSRLALEGLKDIGVGAAKGLVDVGVEAGKVGVRLYGMHKEAQLAKHHFGSMGGTAITLLATLGRAGGVLTPVTAGMASLAGAIIGSRSAAAHAPEDFHRAAAAAKQLGAASAQAADTQRKFSDDWAGTSAEIKAKFAEVGAAASVTWRGMNSDPYLRKFGVEVRDAIIGPIDDVSDAIRGKLEQNVMQFADNIKNVVVSLESARVAGRNALAGLFVGAMGGDAQGLEDEARGVTEAVLAEERRRREAALELARAGDRAMLAQVNAAAEREMQIRADAANTAAIANKKAADERIAALKAEMAAMVEAGKFTDTVTTTDKDGTVRTEERMTAEGERATRNLQAAVDRREQIEKEAAEEQKRVREEYLTAQREREERFAAERDAAIDERNKRAIESEEKLQKSLQDLRSGKGDVRSMVEQLDQRTEERRKAALQLRTKSEQQAAEDAAEAWRYQWLQAIDSVSNTRQMADAFEANAEAGKKAAEEWKAKWAESVQSVAQMLRGGTEQGDVIERIRSQVQTSMQQDPRQVAQQVAERRRQAAARQFTQEHADDYGTDTQSRSRFEAERRKFAEKEARRGYSDVVHGRAAPSEIQAVQDQAFAQTVQAMTAQGNLSPVLAQGLQEAARQAIVASQQAQQAEAMAREALEALGRSKPANRGNRFGGR